MTAAALRDAVADDRRDLLGAARSRARGQDLGQDRLELRIGAQDATDEVDALLRVHAAHGRDHV